MSLSLRRIGCALALLVLTTGIVRGQALRGRVGLQMHGSSIQKTLGPGVHLDAQLPIAGGVSIVGRGAFSAFLLNGWKNGTYTFDPELALKVALPSRSKGATTIFGGGGYHAPFGEEARGSGPTVHLGMGRVWALRESTLFVELAPTLVIREAETSLLMPLRAGVVF